MEAIGLPYFLEIIGLLLIYIYNLPKYCYMIILAVYNKLPLPTYRCIFYVPQFFDKWIRLLGFVTCILIVVTWYFCAG
jgi:hypothetical protein